MLQTTYRISKTRKTLAVGSDQDHPDPREHTLAAQTRSEHCTFLSLDSTRDAFLHERVWLCR